MWTWLKSACRAALWIILIFSAVSANEQDEYFEKSIFQTLKTKNAQFRSEIEVRKRWLVYDLKESYSFKLNIGERIRNQSTGPIKSLYLSNEKEIHRFGTRPQDRFCVSYHWYNLSGIIWELMAYGPKQAFNESSSYNIIGPNVLLEVIYDVHAKNKQNVSCVVNKDEKDENKNARRCSITFKDADRLEYSFVDRDGYTMFPEKIEWFARNSTTGQWQRLAEFIYSKFTPIFGAEPIVSGDLPAGKGCHHWKPENHPRTETNYGDAFELECEISFAYLPKEERNRTSPRWYEDLDRKHLTRSYTTKMKVDRSASINMAETIDEFTNATIRTYYEAKSRLLHSITPKDNKCKSYNLTSDQSLNWFNIQEMFERKSELFNARNYSYLHRTDGEVAYLVFEKEHSYMVWAYDEACEESKRSADRMPTTNRRNCNGVPTRDNYVIATHWYPLEKKHWPDRTGQLSVPKKIRLAIFDSFFYGGVDYLTIDVKSFNANAKRPEKYDTSKCINMDKRERDA